MGEGKYVISEVVNMTQIKPHTIRYWEDELQLNIDRNTMGHRYYSDENIKLFLKIKELKDQGFQLKAIKMLLPNIHTLEEMDSPQIMQLREQMNQLVSDNLEKEETVHNYGTSQKEGTIATGEEVTDQTGVVSTNSKETKPANMTANSSEKIHQFMEILNRVFLEGLQSNNKIIAQVITTEVTENVIKEMDYLFRIKEEREEERYRKLDETIRGVQKSRQEVAITNTDRKRRRRWFRK